MDEDRNRILEDFQACTNIEDIGYALVILEEHGWNLVEAMRSVIPQPEDIGESYGAASLEVQGTPAVIDITDECSTSGFPRTISLTVLYKSQPLQLNVLDSVSVGHVKTLLSSRLSVPSFQMCLVWEDSRYSCTDETLLRELHLPQENTLFLIVVHSVKSNPVLGNSVQLRVLFKDSGKAYDLTLPGTMTVGEVKSSLTDVIHIPAAQQIWTGWPVPANDEARLSECGLNQPLHIAEVCSRQYQSAIDPQRDVNGHGIGTPQQPLDSVDEPIVIDDDGDDGGNSDVEEYHSLDDDDEPGPSASKSSKPAGLQNMLPDAIIDYSLAATHFSKEFTRRYGVTKPEFFVGGLEEAVQHSLHVPARERRPLLIYLHHDRSILANIFCSQVLCTETVVNYLMTNFVVWGWDLTLPSNRDRIVSQANTVLGAFASETVKRLHHDQLPLVLVVSKSRSSLEILHRQDATNSVEELMNGLMQALDVFQSQQQQDIIEQDQRDAREMEKYRQDAAYAASLAADKAKEESKKKEEAERLTREREAKQQEEDEEVMKKGKLASLAASVPAEPEDSMPASTVRTLRLRCFDGAIISRRFRAADRLSAVHAFLATKGYLPDDYRLLVSFPKRELNALDADRSLQDLQLHSQETLILERL